MADLDVVFPDDPDLAELEDLVDNLLIPQLEEIDKKYGEPIAKTLDEVAKGIGPLTEGINEIDSIFKSTRVLADDLSASLAKEKADIDQILKDAKDAEQRTAQNEDQLFQSKISSSNPFNLFYLYQSLDKKYHATTGTTNTASVATATSSTGASSLVSRKPGGPSSHVVTSGQTASANNAQKGTNSPSLPSDEPEVIDLCGGSEDVVPYDADYYQAPNTQPVAEFAKGMKLLAKKKIPDGNGTWYEATLLNVISDKNIKKYKVKFDGMGKKLLFGRHVALKTHPTFDQLKVGSRVVAVYRPDQSSKNLYSGIVAEMPMLTNKGRFLIFYDVGYAQYVDMDDMYLVYQPATNVWEDDDVGDSKDFIMRYLKRYPERPMVRLAVGQWAKTEWNGIWWKAKVKEVDGSLALMHFESDNREEWIYRGSPRLELLFSELSKAEAAERTGNTLVSATSNPYRRRRPTRVEYTTVMEQQLTQPRTTSKNTAKKSTTSGGMSKSPEGRKKGPTAFKSTNRDHHRHKRKKHRHRPRSPPPSPDILELIDSDDENSNPQPETPTLVTSIVTKAQSSTTSPSPMVTSQLQSVSQPFKSGTDNVTIAERLRSASSQIQQQQQLQLQQQQQQHQAIQLQAKRKKQKNQKTFVPHGCNYYCVINCWPNDPNKTFNKNPLRLPQICGWSRELAKTKGSGRRHVIYRTPCGRLLRNLDEVNRYLMETHITYLSVDHFTFDAFVYTLTRKPRTKPIWKIDDISQGAEPMPVSCVNELNSEPLPNIEYIADRLPSGRTVINTDSAFLMCCDCTDNCMDKTKCACWQLTIEASAANPSGRTLPYVGYKNRRLAEHVPTGIFECNSRCKCSQQCHNRVVQNGLKLRLQVFLTNKRGWGLRCLDDIPKGAFVCIYAGQIWTEDMANERGSLYGDEYFAELDYIDVVENSKEGYESDVVSDDLLDKSYNSSEDESYGEDSDEDINVLLKMFPVSSHDEGSDEDYHVGSDSDADYVPKEFGDSSKKKRGGGDSTSQSDTGSIGDGDKPKNSAQVSTRLRFRRSTSSDLDKRPDNQWSVVPSNNGKENQEDKVADWVKDLPAVPSTSQILEQQTTPTKATSSNPMSDADLTPTRLYGYNTNPGNVLDSKALDNFRKRKKHQKAARRRKLDSEMQKSSTGGGSDIAEIDLASSSEDENSRGSTSKKNAIPASKPTTPINKSSDPSNAQGDASNGATPMETTAIGESNSEGGGGDGGFGGLMIEGITSLAVESDDTDESDTEDNRTKGTNDDKKAAFKGSTQHSRMPLIKGNGNRQHGDGNRTRAPPMRTRPYYGEEHNYIMDAKFIGNLGRYMNHSCSPNLFVQNVFIDTHDLRFPWVAFFAHERIQASSELTWDYNYDVGSVPGKVLLCYCGSAQCKGRLL